MQLPNERLEQLHTELCSALSERLSERTRTRHSQQDSLQTLEEAEAEIRDWAQEARKIDADAEDDPALAKLVERAKEINRKLCERIA